MLKQISKIFLVIIFFTTQGFSQSFGFGCFGFVGGYAGYGYQKYEAGSLNEILNNYNSSISGSGSQAISEFGNAYGYRVGINFFRAKFSKVFVSLKGYYEDLSESNDFQHNYQLENIKSSLDFDLKSWNVGLDFGIPISKCLNWKIIEGTIHFNSAKITFKPDLSDNSKDKKYNNDSPEIGYSVSTGFIFSLIENFVSLEGSAGYKFFKIKKMTDGEGNNFSLRPFETYTSENIDFINGGGFSASVQLNIGFPL